jgi:hypothetical protein
MIQYILGMATSLRQDIVHGLAGILIPFAQYSEQPQNFYLQERVRYPCNVVLRTVARRDERFKVPHEHRNRLYYDRHEKPVNQMKDGLTPRNSSVTAGSTSHISVIRVTPDKSTP